MHGLEPAASVHRWETDAATIEFFTPHVLERSSFLRGQRAMPNAHEVADHIIRFCQDRGEPPTHLKVQKLVYYAHAWHLALRDRPLFGDRIEAWVHGPVVRTIYDRFRQQQWKPIVERPDAPDIDADTAAFIDDVMAEYATEGAYALERMTHA